MKVPIIALAMASIGVGFNDYPLQSIPSLSGIGLSPSPPAARKSKPKINGKPKTRPSRRQRVKSKRKDRR